MRYKYTVVTMKITALWDVTWCSLAQWYLHFSASIFMEEQPLLHFWWHTRAVSWYTSYK